MHHVADLFEPILVISDGRISEITFLSHITILRLQNIPRNIELKPFVDY